MNQAASNFDLKEQIRDYWSRRSAGFDQDYAHKVPAGQIRDAWGKAISSRLGTAPGRRVLELGCGTGEITGVLLALGHEVTGLDFSEAMLARATAKHRGRPASFILADAEDTKEPDASFDLVVCRHVMWTLTRPDMALRDWLRVLKPGGHLIVFDGDWANPAPAAPWATRSLEALDRLRPPPPVDMEARAGHDAIMQQLPWGKGLTAELLVEHVLAAGFASAEIGSHAPIWIAQRACANPREWLQTFRWSRFILHARKAG